MFHKWESFEVCEHESDVVVFLLGLMFLCHGDHGTGNVESNYVTDAFCEMHGEKTCSTPGI
jgi:hypothetical protein